MVQLNILKVNRLATTITSSTTTIQPTTTTVSTTTTSTTSTTITSTTTSTTTTTTIPQPQKNSVAIFIDENTYNQLKYEIDRYKLDIENDLDVNVLIYHKNWATKEEVRSKIKLLYENNRLIGAVLIGDIPYAIFEGGGRYGDQDFPSDIYYMNLNDEDFVDEDGDNKFEYIIDLCVIQVKISLQKNDCTNDGCF